MIKVRCVCPKDVKYRINGVQLDRIFFDEFPGSGDHKHEYDERGLCKCGDVWEEDDFSGATPDDR